MGLFAFLLCCLRRPIWVSYTQLCQSSPYASKPQGLYMDQVLLFNVHYARMRHVILLGLF